MTVADTPRPVSLLIEGMTCGSCVARVEGALRAVGGVVDARVNLTTEIATVEWGGPGAGTSSLLQAVRAAGYDAQLHVETDVASTGRLESRDSKRLRQHRQALLMAVGLAIPIIGLEYVGPWLSPSHSSAHLWWRGVQAVLCIMLLASPAGGPILAGGFRAVRHLSPNMDLLVSLGVVAGFLSGVLGFATGHAGHFHFEMVAMILGFINLGRYFETRSRREASGAVAALARRMPATAIRLRDGDTETVPLHMVGVGDRLRVVENTIIPVDARVVAGRAAVDESAMTGESVPVARGEGDPVLGGTIVREGDLTIEATRIGSESAIGRILRAVQDAQSGKTKLQRIADRVAGVFVPVVVGLALLTFAGWIVVARQGWWSVDGAADGSAALSHALRCAIAVLVIACPCAMGLATPTAVLVATGTAALRGILVRNAAALEAAGQVDVVLLDKTGTLTTGRPTIKTVFDEPRGAVTLDEAEVLKWAASAEQFSQHPLARAIVEQARIRGMELMDPDDFKNVPGQGVEARFGDRRVLVGSPGFLCEAQVDLTSIEERLQSLATDGQTVIVLAVDGVCAGVIGLTDSVRPGSAQCVAELHAAGIRTAMVTGDHAVTAAAVASEVGITEVHAEVSPVGKLALVRRLQREGRRVAFVGDGINDAPALTAADVGIAFAAGTDTAIEAADITLVREDPTLIAVAVRQARRSVRIIKQNLFWAFFYNVLAIPLAATGQISPRYAAAVMMMSSISVVLNSLRLRERASEMAPH